MGSIAKLEPVEIRELWKHEGRGFSAWLAENLDTLSEAVGLTLQNPIREKEVGRFSLDLLTETDGGTQVIIENQLDVTNHDHLGKVLTYLSNLEAKIAIWIAGDIREEHAEAIRWLNEFTPADTAFFLVKLSAFRINGSDPAPHFAVVAGRGRRRVVASVRRRRRLLRGSCCACNSGSNFLRGRRNRASCGMPRGRQAKTCGLRPGPAFARASA